MNRIHIRDLGLVDYQAAWDLQNELAANIAAGSHSQTLLLLEHPHTFTFGRRGQVANLLWDDAELARRGVVVHWVDRGGDVTYHGPGQLVGYPLLKLVDQNHVGYIRKLEQVIVLALANMGLPAVQVAGLSGVWVLQRGTPAKIAAIGVKVDANNITRHGFSLNVNPQMSYFNGIVPCGIPDHPVVSMAELRGDVPEMRDVKLQIGRAFLEIFDFLT